MTRLIDFSAMKSEEVCAIVGEINQRYIDMRTALGNYDFFKKPERSRAVADTWAYERYLERRLASLPDRMGLGQRSFIEYVITAKKKELARLRDDVSRRAHSRS